MTTEISIHALLAESDLPAANLGDGRTIHFYPRSPCGERPLAHFFISREQIFLSTLSLRRATICMSAKPPKTAISIHALLAESDRAHVAAEARCQKISIHALLAESDVSICGASCPS